MYDKRSLLLKGKRMATTASLTGKVLQDNRSYVRLKGADRSEAIALIKAYIEESCPDLVPSDKNAGSLLESAGAMSLAALSKEGKAVGFILVCPIENVQ